MKYCKYIEEVGEMLTAKLRGKHIEGEGYILDSIQYYFEEPINNTYEEGNALYVYNDRYTVVVKHDGERVLLVYARKTI